MSLSFLANKFLCSSTEEILYVKKQRYQSLKSEVTNDTNLQCIELSHLIQVCINFLCSQTMQRVANEVQ